MFLLAALGKNPRSVNLSLFSKEKLNLSFLFTFIYCGGVEVRGHLEGVGALLPSCESLGLSHLPGSRSSSWQPAFPVVVNSGPHFLDDCQLEALGSWSLLGHLPLKPILPQTLKWERGNSGTLSDRSVGRLPFLYSLLLGVSPTHGFQVLPVPDRDVITSHVAATPDSFQL